MSDATLPGRNPDTLISGFDDAYVVFDPRCGEVHLLEALSAVIFDACDGSDRNLLVEDISEILGIDRSAADASISNHLDEFARKGLLVGTAAAERPP